MIELDNYFSKWLCLMMNLLCFSSDDSYYFMSILANRHSLVWKHQNTKLPMIKNNFSKYFHSFLKELFEIFLRWNINLIWIWMCLSVFFDKIIRHRFCLRMIGNSLSLKTFIEKILTKNHGNPDFVFFSLVLLPSV